MPLTTRNEYPAGIPLPVREGYGFTPVSPLLRTEMNSGRVRQRRRFVTTPVNVSVTWKFTGREACAFESWYRSVIGDGQAWFNMRLKTPAGMMRCVCRFTDIYDGPQLISGKRCWKYTATLELWERPIHEFVENF